MKELKPNPYAKAHTYIKTYLYEQAHTKINIQTPIHNHSHINTYEQAHTCTNTHKPKHTLKSTHLHKHLHPKLSTLCVFIGDIIVPFLLVYTCTQVYKPHPYWQLILHSDANLNIQVQ